jgi:hypothetical protein
MLGEFGTAVLLSSAHSKDQFLSVLLGTAVFSTWGAPQAIWWPFFSKSDAELLNLP